MECFVLTAQFGEQTMWQVPRVGGRCLARPVVVNRLERPCWLFTNSKQLTGNESGWRHFLIPRWWRAICCRLTWNVKIGKKCFYMSDSWQMLLREIFKLIIMSVYLFVFFLQIQTAFFIVNSVSRIVKMFSVSAVLDLLIRVVTNL